MASLNLHSTYKMLSGYEIPVLGYGVYQTPAAEAEDATSYALKTGYRHIDSARMYRNEGPCAAAMKKSGIPRSELFFTSKVPPQSMGYEKTKAVIAATLKETGLDYIDLYLIHAPYGGRAARLGSWDAFVEAQAAGQIRSLGVSNYGIDHLDELEAYIAELESQRGAGKAGQISVGQWEWHPWCDRQDIHAWCRAHGVVAQAYSPLVQGTRLAEPALAPMARRAGKTPAQVLLRWALDKGLVPLPKSVTPARIEENAQLYDFALSAEEMEALDTGIYKPVCWDPTRSGLDNVNRAVQVVFSAADWVHAAKTTVMSFWK